MDLSSVIQLSVLLQFDNIEICIACMQKVIFKKTLAIFAAACTQIKSGPHIVLFLCSI